MIYNKRYTAEFYEDSRTGIIPVYEHIKGLDSKVRAKIYKYINFLLESNGYLDEPYSRHIIDKIRELRVDFAGNRHRIFYFSFIDRQIVFLHAFLKKTDKTPFKEIAKAQGNYQDFISNYKM
jgi:phage-related protein